jgi:hypothetical protein
MENPLRLTAHDGFGEGAGETRLSEGRKVRPVPTLRSGGGDREAPTDHNHPRVVWQCCIQTAILEQEAEIPEELVMSLEFFHHLCSALEIRSNSEADRDRELYGQVRSRLGMGTSKPREFFAANPDITDAQILAAFLDVLQPFTEMLEFIFEVCSRAARGATGGHDFEIRYDPAADSLRFDLDAFKRWREVYMRVRGQAVIPRYNSDAVPTYGRDLERLSVGDKIYWHQEASVEPVEISEIRRLLQRAREVGQAHLQALEALFVSVEDDADITEEVVERWRTERGIEDRWVPHTADGLRRWQRHVESGLEALQHLDPETLAASYSPDELRAAIGALNWALDSLSQIGDAEGWMHALEEWLQFPYWKKRWQLYEVWIFAVCLNALLEGGGSLNLNESLQLVLRTGTTEEPLGQISFNASNRIELWMEYPLIALSGKVLRPDIAFVVSHRDSRIPVSFIECKQRVNVAETAMLEDASKYLASMPLQSEHLLVNYDRFREVPTDRRYRIEHDWRELIALDEVRPGGKGLPALLRFVAQTIGAQGTCWFVLVDTTGSMHHKLGSVADHLLGLEDRVQGEDTLFLILYGDHNDDYTVRLHRVTHTAEDLVQALRNAPLTEGGDTPEALEDALHFVVEETRRRGIRADHIVVFADAEAHPPEECPNGYDFQEEIKILIEAGSDIVLVSCDVEPQRLGWDMLDQAKAYELWDHYWS